MTTLNRLADSIPDSGPLIYHNPELRTALEYHIPYLRMSEKSSVIEIDPATALKYKGDLDGLLVSLGIPPKYHWAIMRVNDMYCSSDYDEAGMLIQPPFDEVDRIVSIWTTQVTNRQG